MNIITKTIHLIWFCAKNGIKFCLCNWNQIWVSNPGSIKAISSFASFVALDRR